MSRIESQLWPEACAQQLFRIPPILNEPLQGGGKFCRVLRRACRRQRPGRPNRGLLAAGIGMARMMHWSPYQNSQSPPATVIDRIDALLQVKRTALNVRAYRQELLASNIANADTPHFKARDIDFKGALEGALAGRMEGNLSLATTSSRHLGNESGQPMGVAVKYRTEFQPNVDGNTVNMDVERAAFADNAVQMEAMLTFIRSDLSTLQTAMSSQ